MKKIILLTCFAAILYACGGNSSKEQKESESAPGQTSESTEAAPPSDKGIGKFQDVQLGDKLDPALATKGQSVYDVKCSSCHKLSGEKLVGPGWEGVTKRHRPEWIMNFVTNVDEMLDKDPKAQAQLEVCLVRMPNQNLSDDDARNVLEFMRKNDGVQ